MKKWTTFLAIPALSLGLVACNETTTPTKETNVTETSKLTLKEVYDKSIKVSEELESVKVVVDMKQTMQMPKQNANLDYSSLMDMKYIIEPMQIYQTTTVHGKNQVVDIESYITKDASYMYEGTSKQWMKLPQEMMEQLTGAVDQYTPVSQLTTIESYLEDFTFEQDKKKYILTLEESGEKFKKLVQEQVNEAILQNMVGDQKVLTMDMTINSFSLNYLIHIDKDSFQMNKLDFILDVDMMIVGEKANMKQNVKFDFSNFNKIDEIVIPQEVIDSAVEI
ncbi:DUF6612 family protein [Psychrobacillus vulpis]|uniref:LppX_LprAFG lipoprotein n=1 Tax=Psychrobacillus vulpis TaxID=2325572 RepID=A0A544TVQ2_9BACI|nr:DUF6612 family protein [Psychrobacillus vulpis]TQR21530.1 hypothetical protein FG384_00825 [Psychrobacillus vulpis]